MLSEIRQLEKDMREIPYDFTYMWNLMGKINKQNRNRLVDRENRVTAVRWGGVRGLGEKEEGI